MQKTYIVPALEVAGVKAGMLMEGSLKYDSGKTISNEGEGGWTRRQLWLEEEEEL